MNILASINWNLDPEIFPLGPFSVRWYGLLFALAIYLGYVIIDKIYKSEGFKQESVDKLSFYTVIGMVLGARLGHCLFYEPEYYLSNPLEILKIWHGGLASHGAAVGILIALYLFSRKLKLSFLSVLDRIVIVVALGGFFVRLGNFMNSEIYGVATSLPWGVVFEQNKEEIAKHPTQIYEALSYLAIFFVLYWYYKKNVKTMANGNIFGWFLIMLFGVRFFIEFIKEVQVNFEDGMTLNMGQWLSIPFISLGIGILLTRRKKDVKE
ncbi:MAG: prolipoprotein diacylglyceryl transferase [Bacteroidales bacterium]|jgi:prolipoprotein diacylglyceryl transferase|nr:prolipoprotein diacylglyceryl transferase [Bacteroidales bacterium]